MAEGSVANSTLHKYAAHNKSRVYIRQLAFTVKEQDLYNRFIQYGDILCTYVVRRNGATTGMAYITFKYGFQANAAVIGANGAYLHNRYFSVQIDRPHPSITETPFPIDLFSASNFWDMLVAENPFPGALYLHYVGPR